MKDKLIYVEWCDAIERTHGWISKEEALDWGKEANWIVKETGFLLKETKKYILLAARVSKYSDDDIQYSGIMKIPTTWIIKRTELN